MQTKAEGIGALGDGASRAGRMRVIAVL